MSGTAQISVTLPNAVLEAVDAASYARRTNKTEGRASRSAVVADAVALQLGAKPKVEVRS